MTGAEARAFASIAVAMPVQPQASSSVMMQPSSVPRPMPPYSGGTWVFISPSSHAFFATSRGNSPVSSWCAAFGAISSRANFRASS